MSEKNLDITGKVCPFCVIETRKALETLSCGDVLVVVSDHPPAATNTIPLFARANGMSCEITKTAPGLWEIRIIKK
jgi:tRNA 2-thiouridine synthesizing protein A